MINAEFLASCTDEQIEKGVAWLRFCEIVEAGDDWKDCIGLSEIPKNPDWPRYCSNPRVIMPIAFANKIGTRFSLDNGWIARNKVVLSYNENPLRAICEVYILMSVNK